MNNDDFNDDLSGIFDDLTPADFIVDTSAVSTTAGTYSGPEAFATFLESQLHAVRVTFSQVDQFNPMAVLANATTLRVILPDDDETIGAYLKRIQREAGLLGAHWFFYAMRTDVGPVEIPDHAEMNADDPRARALMKAETSTDSIVWHVESTETSSRGLQAGFMPITQNRIEEGTGSPIEATIGALENILWKRDR